MEKTTTSFDYNGATFTPHANFEDFGLKDASFKEIGNLLYEPHNPRFKNRHCGGEDYDLNAFYEAAGGYDNCKADVFRNEANGLLYVPSNNVLWVFLPYEDSKRKFKLDRERAELRLSELRTRMTALKHAIDIINEEGLPFTVENAEERLEELCDEFTDLSEREATI